MATVYSRGWARIDSDDLRLLRWFADVAHAPLAAVDSGVGGRKRTENNVLASSSVVTALVYSVIFLVPASESDVNGRRVARSRPIHGDRPGAMNNCATYTTRLADSEARLRSNLES